MRLSSLILSTACLFISTVLSAEEPSSQSLTQRQVLQKFNDFGIPELEKGKELYERVCLVCHGNQEQGVINETIRQFHTQELKNGSDPYSLYQTLTKGFNTMVPQTWMKPEEKYYVIHYIREAFFREANPSQYIDIDEAYLAALDTEEINKEPLQWPIDNTPVQLREEVAPSEVDLGRALFGHFEVDANNTVPKGLIVALDPDAKSVADSQHNALYDLDTGRLAAFWTGGSLDWEDLNYNGKHSRNARIVGEAVLESPMGLAWATSTEVLPGQGPDFRDPREEGRDGRRYGPLPKKHYQYMGLFLDGEHPTLHYTVHDAEVLDSTYLRVIDDVAYYVRSLHIAPHQKTLYLRAQGKQEHVTTKTNLRPFNSIGINDGIFRVEPSNKRRVFHFVATAPEHRETLNKTPLNKLWYPTPPPFTEITATTAQYGKSPTQKTFPSNEVGQAVYKQGNPDESFRIDTIELPEDFTNPWKTRLRFSGIDYLDENTAAISSWTGGLYLAKNIRGTDGPTVSLSRITAGLHQPLGLVVRDGEIFVGCRDQIMRPHDFNNDGVADYLEAFNTDHVVTMHFHDFAGGLDTDPEGNFYYSKCSQHLDPAIIERHGSLIKVRSDGENSEIVARGLRSNNGCFFDEKTNLVWLTDQEGFWNPQNKIIRVQPDSFNGNMLAFYDSNKVTHADTDSTEPMVWLPKIFANSPSEVFRFPDRGWGGLNGVLGYFEYGKGRIMVLPHEEKNGTVQGASHGLPIPDFPTGIMRGRFHPDDQSLLACGLFGWGSSRTQTGGLFRIIPTEKPSHSLVGFEASPGKLSLTFSDPILNHQIDPTDIQLTSFHIERSAKYGSQLKGETHWPVTDLSLSDDGLTLALQVPSLAPTRVLNIKLKLPGEDGPIQREIHASIYHLGEQSYDSIQSRENAKEVDRARTEIIVPSAHPIPGKIQAEAFRNGPEGDAYHDTDDKEGTKEFRPKSRVDLEPSRDKDTTPSIGWIRNGEWLTYTIEVKKPFQTTPSFRIASKARAKLILELKTEEQDKFLELSSLNIESTGGIYSWKNQKGSAFELPAGTHTLRIRVEKGSFNFNWFELP